MVPAWSSATTAACVLRTAHVGARPTTRPGNQRSRTLEGDRVRCSVERALRISDTCPDALDALGRVRGRQWRRVRCRDPRQFCLSGRTPPYPGETGRLRIPSSSIVLPTIFETNRRGFCGDIYGDTWAGREHSPPTANRPAPRHLGSHSHTSRAGRPPVRYCRRWRLLRPFARRARPQGGAHHSPAALCERWPASRRYVVGQVPVQLERVADRPRPLPRRHRDMA